jgi:hypothetical protein
MSQRNGQSNLSSPGQETSVGKDVGKLARDCMSLAELQLELLRGDCRKDLRRLSIPLGLMLCAAIAAVGTAPVALLCLAEWLRATAGLSRLAALFASSSAGSIAVLLLGLLAWFRMRSLAGLFVRSRKELARNAAWINDALKRP